VRHRLCLVLSLSTLCFLGNSRQLDWTAGPQRAAGRMSSPAYLSPTLPEPYTDENVGEPRDGTGL
jgi:hypothetical protein